MTKPIIEKTGQRHTAKKAVSGIIWVVLLLFVMVFAIGVVSGYMDAKNGFTGGAESMASSGRHLGQYLWVIVAGSVALALISIPLSLVWWRTLDEGQKEAHKWAWIWGGAAGLTLPAPLAVICSISAPGEFFDPTQSPETFFFHAYVGILLCALLGYGAAWIIWWWRHR